MGRDTLHTADSAAELLGVRPSTIRWWWTIGRLPRTKIGRLVVQRQPVCGRCDLSLTEIVDHIVPAREALGQCRASGAYLDRNAGYYLLSNLQGSAGLAIG